MSLFKSKISKKSSENSFSQLSAQSHESNDGTWTCKHCGSHNQSTAINCKDCGKYR